jgi:hypothetical protein
VAGAIIGAGVSSVAIWAVGEVPGLDQISVTAPHGQAISRAASPDGAEGTADVGATVGDGDLETLGPD